MLKSFCLIPARSGSKGLKNKNILDLCGKPVLAYTIEVCKASGIFDDVFVATDSEEYAKIGEHYGAIVPFLEPQELAGDSITSTEPVIYFYKKLRAKADLLWCMQPTSPLRAPEDIQRAYSILESDKNCNFILGTTEIDPHYFHWAMTDGEYTSLYFGKEMLVDRSELKLKVFRPNGAIKAGRTEAVLQCRNFFGDKIKRVDMPEERAIHIRSINDFLMCEMLLSQKKMNINYAMLKMAVAEQGAD